MTNNNGVTFCDVCDNECEQSEISVREDFNGECEEVCRTCIRQENMTEDEVDEMNMLEEESDADVREDILDMYYNEY